MLFRLSRQIGFVGGTDRNYPISACRLEFLFSTAIFSAAWLVRLCIAILFIYRDSAQEKVSNGGEGSRRPSKAGMRMERKTPAAIPVTGRTRESGFLPGVIRHLGGSIENEQNQRHKRRTDQNPQRIVPGAGQHFFHG